MRLAIIITVVIVLVIVLGIVLVIVRIRTIVGGLQEQGSLFSS